MKVRDQPADDKGMKTMPTYPDITVTLSRPSAWSMTKALLGDLGFLLITLVFWIFTLTTNFADSPLGMLMMLAITYGGLFLLLKAREA